MEEIKFALDTFYAVMAGALVMWMAAGFTMLEAGMVQKKDVSEIVTKNLGLYSIACIMYLICGFALMYSGDSYLGLFSLISAQNKCIQRFSGWFVVLFSSSFFPSWLL